MTVITHEVFLATLRERFGEDPADWAFVCPSCGDIATGRDFRAALEEHPRTTREGQPILANQLMGQECIGRTLGALLTTREEWDRRRHAGEARGCDWVAYGLFNGPLSVETAMGVVSSFNIAEVA